jgi:hypothetical protein
MTSFENFHHQFRGLVERAMLSELEDMLRSLAEALRPVASDAQVHVEHAAEALHAARRRGMALEIHGSDGLLYGGVQQPRHPRNRIDVPRERCLWCGSTDGHRVNCGKLFPDPVPGDDEAAGTLPV